MSIYMLLTREHFNAYFPLIGEVSFCVFLPVRPPRLFFTFSANSLGEFRGGLIIGVLRKPSRLSLSVQFVIFRKTVIPLVAEDDVIKHPDA